MKEIILKLIQISFIILMIILSLFLLVDCKMDNEKLSLKISLLRDDYEELNIETEEMRKYYAKAFYHLVEQNRITVDDLITLLPEKEIQYIKSLSAVVP